MVARTGLYLWLRPAVCPKACPTAPSPGPHARVYWRQRSPATAAATAGAAWRPQTCGHRLEGMSRKHASMPANSEVFHGLERANPRQTTVYASATANPRDKRHCKSGAGRCTRVIEPFTLVRLSRPSLRCRGHARIGRYKATQPHD